MHKLLAKAAQAANRFHDIHRIAFMGAVAERHDGVIVVSRNGSAKDKSPPSHAEIRVLRKSGYGATVYVARVLRNGERALAKPCSNCMSALKAKGVEEVYFTTGKNDWEKLKL